MLKTISLLCPTRGRPHRLKEMLESVIITAQNPENVEVFFYIDNDDNKKDEYLETINKLLDKYKTNLKKCDPYIGEPMSISKSWNILAERCSGDILAMSNDDLVYITKGWDVVASKESEKYPDGIYCMWFNDLIQYGSSAAFPMVSRVWYKTLGYFTPGVFRFLCNDSWIYYIAKNLQRLHYIGDDVIVEHRHASYNKSEMDDTYKMHIDGGKNSDYTHDNELFYSDWGQNEIIKEADKLRKIASYSTEELQRQIMYLSLELNKTNNLLKNLNTSLDKINKLDKKTDKIIDSLAWLIPFRKLRNSFRDNLKS